MYNSIYPASAIVFGQIFYFLVANKLIQEGKSHTFSNTPSIVLSGSTRLVLPPGLLQKVALWPMALWPQVEVGEHSSLANVACYIVSQHTVAILI